MAFLYRGVHADHPAIEAARLGIVLPADPEGDATPEEHNADDRLGHSPFTSWTTSLATAEFRRDLAGSGGVLLVVPQAGPRDADSWRWEWSPNDYFEDEILMRGIRIGVEVRY